MEWKPSQVVAPECQAIESVQLNLVILLPGMQGVEVRYPIDAKNDRFAAERRCILMLLLLPIPVTDYDRNSALIVYVI